MEPSWPKLVEPLERIVDRMAVVWGAVSHLKAVKDNADLRSAIEEVQVHIRIDLHFEDITRYVAC